MNEFNDVTEPGLSMKYRMIIKMFKRNRKSSRKLNESYNTISRETNNLLYVKKEMEKLMDKWGIKYEKH